MPLLFFTSGSGHACLSTDVFHDDPNDDALMTTMIDAAKAAYNSIPPGDWTVQ